MSLEIKTGSGKVMAMTDCEEETVIVNNKAIPLSDVYASDKLREEFNDEIKTSAIEDTDVKK